jgi:hypothetical protein
MILHGSIADNLTAAVRSSRRLRGKPVHGDTIAFWRELLAEARAEEPPPGGSADPSVTDLADQLEAELALIDKS